MTGALLVLRGLLGVWGFCESGGNDHLCYVSAVLHVDAVRVEDALTYVTPPPAGASLVACRLGVVPEDCLDFVHVAHLLPSICGVPSSADILVMAPSSCFVLPRDLYLRVMA